MQTLLFTTAPVTGKKSRCIGHANFLAMPLSDKDEDGLLEFFIRIKKQINTRHTRNRVYKDIYASIIR